MSLLIFGVLVIVNLVRAGAPGYALPEPYAVPNYDFGYAVNDPHTGDSKSQHEIRHGDVVQGSYSVVDPDGTKRIVDYSADSYNGFNAVVHREPAAVAAATYVDTPIVAKVAVGEKYTTPGLSAYASPSHTIAKYAATPLGSRYHSTGITYASDLTSHY